MDDDGVWAELLFPTFPRFGGTQFLAADDTDLALAIPARRRAHAGRARRADGNAGRLDRDAYGPAARRSVDGSASTATR
jgi:hypothetical protein